MFIFVCIYISKCSKSNHLSLNFSIDNHVIFEFHHAFPAFVHFIYLASVLCHVGQQW